jgi:hypothetical protein
MANLIYGINSKNGLSELLSKRDALETLGLRVNDLVKIGNTGSNTTSLSDKVSTTKFHHLSQASGSPNQVFKENIIDRIDRFAKAAKNLPRRLEELAGPSSISLTGINTESIQGNIVVNGPVSAPSIRYFSTELLNAETGQFEPLDISTSRVSSWNTSKPTLSFGGDLTIDNLSPAFGAGGHLKHIAQSNLSVPQGDETPKIHIGLIRIDGRAQKQPITSRAFAAETATHKLKVKINGEEMYLYAMKNIPLVFEGIFKGYGNSQPLFTAKRYQDVGPPADFRIFRGTIQEALVRSGNTNRPCKN